MTAGLAGGSDVVPGIASGKLVPSLGPLVHARRSIPSRAGVSLSGTLKLVEAGGLPLRFQGNVTVGGKFAATGLLGVSGAERARDARRPVVGQLSAPRCTAR